MSAFLSVDTLGFAQSRDYHKHIVRNSCSLEAGIKGVAMKAIVANIDKFINSADVKYYDLCRRDLQRYLCYTGSGKSVSSVNHNAVEQSPSPGWNREEFEAARARETSAYHQMLPKLLEQHGGEYVAILNGQLLDHDPDEDALLRRVYCTYPDAFHFVRRVGEHRSRRSVTIE